MTSRLLLAPGVRQDAKIAEMAEKRLFAKAQGRGQHQLGAAARKLLQSCDAAIGQHAVRRQQNRAGLVPMRHLAGHAVADTHVLVARDARRAWRQFEIDRLDVLLEPFEHCRILHRRPIVGPGSDKEFAAVRRPQRRYVARR